MTHSRNILEAFYFSKANHVWLVFFGPFLAGFLFCFYFSEKFTFTHSHDFRLKVPLIHSREEKKRYFALSWLVIVECRRVTEIGPQNP